MSLPESQIGEKLDELLDRWEELSEQGQSVDIEALCAADPKLLTPLKNRIERLQRMEWLDQTDTDPCANRDPKSGRCIESSQKARSIPSSLAGGRYKIESLVSEGGFGQVWRATDTILERTVAVKLTEVNCVDEARRVAKLKHPGIVTVHDVGKHDPYCYIVFDLVEGTDLERLITKDRPDWRQAAALVASVAENLDYAHERGLVHRDIKPANILIDEEGKPFIADFGIAVTRCELMAEMQRSAGTVAYMSPEQLDEQQSQQLDARSDVYSLGVVLYELLTGERPFRAKGLWGLRQRVLDAKYTPITEIAPSVPLTLAAIAAQAMSRKPDDRFATALQLATALRSFLESDEDADS